MNTGGDAAEQVVRLSLEGMEVTAKIAGAGAKQIAAILYALMKDQNKTHGKARLSSMLRSGQELKVFTVPNKDLKKFQQQAKRYGVLYCALRKDKTDPDGMTDIMVRAIDASKINRIVERFKMEAAVDTRRSRRRLQNPARSRHRSRPQRRCPPGARRKSFWMNCLPLPPTRKSRQTLRRPGRSRCPIRPSAPQGNPSRKPDLLRAPQARSLPCAQSWQRFVRNSGHLLAHLKRKTPEISGDLLMANRPNSARHATISRNA